MHACTAEVCLCAVQHNTAAPQARSQPITAATSNTCGTHTRAPHWPSGRACGARFGQQHNVYSHAHLALHLSLFLGFPLFFTQSAGCLPGCGFACNRCNRCTAACLRCGNNPVGIVCDVAAVLHDFTGCKGLSVAVCLVALDDQVVRFRVGLGPTLAQHLERVQLTFVKQSDHKIQIW